MRKLIIVPIVHTPEDLGSYLPAARKQYVARYGLKHWHQRLGMVEELWKGIQQRVLALPLDFSKTRLYQDGLPECGRELEIVEELAREGSRNHQLLLELVQRGAMLMGTESLPLLMEERERLVKQRVTQKRRAEKEDGLYDELIERRDEYIAQRIAATLQDGETGLLFIGALHRVAGKLPKEIATCNLYTP